MAKNEIKIIDETTAVVSKAFAKKAVIFGTDEYKLWKEFKKDFPNAEMTTKTITKKTNKITYKNMTLKNMKLYIMTAENDETRDAVIAEFEKQKLLSKIQTSPYKAVLAWFLQKYPNYNEYKAYFDKLAEKEKAKAETADTENTEQ